MTKKTWVEDNEDSKWKRRDRIATIIVQFVVAFVLVFAFMALRPAQAAGKSLNRIETLSMIAIIWVYHNNCGHAFRDEQDEGNFIDETSSAFSEAAILDAYRQIDAKRKKLGAEKFCSEFKPAIEAFKAR